MREYPVVTTSGVHRGVYRAERQLSGHTVQMVYPVPVSLADLEAGKQDIGRIAAMFDGRSIITDDPELPGAIGYR